MTGGRAAVAALGLSLTLHGGVAAILWSAGGRPTPESAVLPPAPLVVDLVEPVVAVFPRAPAVPVRGPRSLRAAARASRAAPHETPAPPVAMAVPVPPGPPTAVVVPPPVAPSPSPAPLPAPAASPPGGAPAPTPAAAPRPAPTVTATPGAAPAPASGGRTEGGERGGWEPAIAGLPSARPRDRLALGAAPGAGAGSGGAPGEDGGLAPPGAGQGTAPEVEAAGAGEVAALPRDGAPPVPAEYDAYVRGLRQRIQAQLRYPWLAARRGLRGVVELEVRLGPDGRLVEVGVIGGDAAGPLRDAALRAVREATPFPFPVGVASRPLIVRLPVVFELR